VTGDRDQAWTDIAAVIEERAVSFHLVLRTRSGYFRLGRHLTVIETLA
jgi:hypothetical protein